MKQMLIALGFPKPPTNINCFQLFSKVEAKVSVKDYLLTLCMLGNFSCNAFKICCLLLNFFKINFFEKFFQEHYQSVSNALDPDLGPNCMQRLSADDKVRHWQAKSYSKGLVWSHPVSVHTFKHYYLFNQIGQSSLCYICSTVKPV